MKVLVLGTIDTKGGAAQISWEIRKRLKADGYSVSTFVRYKYSDESDVFAIPRARWQDWLVKLFANDLRFARTGYIFDTKEYKEADIIHCHNLHSNFFNLKDLARMSAEKPVVWTIHDLWAVTGFANNSATRRHPNKKKFMLFLWDRTSALLRAKERIYKASKLHVVAVSEWMKREISASALGAQDVARIYNGIDTAIFYPRDKTAARKQLGLPTDKKHVGFPIKGWNDSNKVVDSFLGRDDVFFSSIGAPTLTTDNKNYRSFEYTDDPEKIAAYLSALDVFFYPTTGDSFGLIAAQAQACGTPVVAYGVDALPEVVEDGKTGAIVKEGDIAASKAAIERAFGFSARTYAAERAKRLFSLDRMYKEYLTLYARILKKSS